MTNEEFQKALEEITIKCNQLAQIQQTMASTTTEGLRVLLGASKVLQASTENLLETIQLHKRILANHEDRIAGMEGAA